MRPGWTAAAWRTSAILLLMAGAHAQSQSWIRQLGSMAMDRANSMASDGVGGMFLVGDTQGSFGGAHSGGYDAWLAHCDALGNTTWVRQLGTSVDDYANGAAADGTGGVYVVGTTAGNLGGPSVGNLDAWLARYDAAGNQLWIRQAGTWTAEWARAAAPDASGGVYLVGETLGSFGGPNATGFTDAWLARYDASGNQIWSRQLGSPVPDWTYAAAADGSGGVFLAGKTLGDLAGPNAGGYDAWLSHYDGAGNPLWSAQLGSAADDISSAAASDGAGGAYIGGATTGSFGAPYAGFTDAWLARIDASGAQLWVRQLGTDQWDDVLGAAPDGFGGVSVCGSSAGSLEPGQGAGSDAWMARYSAGGEQSWLRQFGSNQYEAAYATVMDAAGAVLLCGYTAGMVASGGAGANDAWVALYDACSPYTYCVSNPNSAGQSATIGNQGSTSLGANGLVLEVIGGVPGRIGLFFMGKTKVEAVFGDGYLCVSGNLIRLYPAQILDGTGAASYPVDFTDLNSPLSQLQPGDARDFQFWYRDPASSGTGFNLSDGLSAYFCP